MGSLYRRKPRGNWHGAYFDAGGRRIQKSTGTANKQVATEILRRWEQDAHALHHGIASNSRGSLASLVDEYIAYLGNTEPNYRRYAQASLERIFLANDWTQPNQITQFAVETTVRQFLDPRTGEKISLRTQAHYIGTAKSFTRWLRLVRKVITTDPLEGIKKPNPNKDRKRIRRFLLPTEWPWLARTSNALLYETAIQTGYRASELLKLGPQHLHDDHLSLPARETKNRTTAKQYVTASLAERLRGQLPFAIANRGRLADMLTRDLRIARWFADQEGEPLPDDFLAATDARGHYLDFHALRHTCGAWLALSGVQPKVIQAVMRHSSITLTLDTYGHLLPGAEQDAIQHFAKLMSADLSHEKARRCP